MQSFVEILQIPKAADGSAAFGDDLIFTPTSGKPAYSFSTNSLVSLAMTNSSLVGMT